MPAGSCLSASELQGYSEPSEGHSLVVQNHRPEHLEGEKGVSEKVNILSLFVKKRIEMFPNERYIV